MLASETIPKPKPRVLVVDDSEDAADSLADLLAAYEFDTYVAYSGIEALAVGDLVRPQCVILDISMRRMDGCETARRMRDRAWGRQARFVALTAFSDEETRRNAVQAGIEFYFTKPVVFEELLRVLDASGSEGGAGVSRDAPPPSPVLSCNQ